MAENKKPIEEQSEKNLYCDRCRTHPDEIVKVFAAAVKTYERNDKSQRYEFVQVSSRGGTCTCGKCGTPVVVDGGK